MTTNASIAISLAAFGQDTRLEVFRLLDRTGGEGQNVGKIGRHFDRLASTLAHHVKTPVDA